MHHAVSKVGFCVTAKSWFDVEVDCLIVASYAPPAAPLGGGFSGRRSYRIMRASPKQQEHNTRHRASFNWHTNWMAGTSKASAMSRATWFWRRQTINDYKNKGHDSIFLFNEEIKIRSSSRTAHVLQCVSVGPLTLIMARMLSRSSFRTPPETVTRIKSRNSTITDTTYMLVCARLVRTFSTNSVSTRIPSKE